jgi:hypothetical protein
VREVLPAAKIILTIHEYLAICNHYIQHFFASVDHFIAPSVFLRQLYVEWGIAEDAITMLENVVRPSLAPARLSHTRMDAARMLEDVQAIRSCCMANIASNRLHSSRNLSKSWKRRRPT